MEKTNFGISIKLTSALMLLICLFGGYIPAIIFAGYILLKEENTWLKKNTLGALFLLVVFSALSYLINLVPDFVYLTDNFVGLFGGYCDASVLQNIINMINNILDIVKTVMFLLFALKIFKGKEVTLPFTQKIFERNIEE